MVGAQGAGGVAGAGGGSKAPGGGLVSGVMAAVLRAMGVLSVVRWRFFFGAVISAVLSRLGRYLCRSTAARATHYAI